MESHVQDEFLSGCLEIPPESAAAELAGPAFSHTPSILLHALSFLNVSLEFDLTTYRSSVAFCACLTDWQENQH